MDQFFTRWRGKVSGPHSKAQLIQMAKDGQLTRHHSVSTDMANWQQATDLAWVFAPSKPVEPEPSEATETVAAQPMRAPDPAKLPDRKWYYSQAGKPQIGPVVFEVLQQFAGAGQIHPTDQVWSEGSPSWIPAAQVPGLVFAPPAPPPSAVPNKISKPNERRQVMRHMSKYCEACGEAISATSKACPNCGHLTTVPSTPNALGHLALALALASLLLFPPFLGLASFICAIVFLVQTSSKGYGVVVLLLSIVCPIIGIVLGISLSS
jgi:hypothetical protein